MKSNARILLWKGNQAVVKTDDEILNISQETLSDEMKNHAMPLPEARQTLLMDGVKEKVTLSPFELKQHFVERGDFVSAQKVGRLKTDRPEKALKTIGAEISFFGQSFLEGFLDFYGIKCDTALKRYERRIGIIEEQHLDTGQRKASVCQVIHGKFEKLAEYETLHEARAAKEKLEKHKELENEIAVSRRLDNEKDI